MKTIYYYTEDHKWYNEIFHATEICEIVIDIHWKENIIYYNLLVSTDKWNTSTVYKNILNYIYIKDDGKLVIYQC